VALQLEIVRPSGSMNRSFLPSFQHFQKDVELYLKSEGKCEKNAIGQTVYRGYQAAVALMFRTYMEKKAFLPLVATRKDPGRVSDQDKRSPSG